MVMIVYNLYITHLKMKEENNKFHYLKMNNFILIYFNLLYLYK